MGKYEYIFFDLDGTLNDSGPGILNSFTYAIEQMGGKVEDRSQLKKFVGPPLRTSFEESLGYSPEDADKAIGFYREYYHGKGGLFGYGDEPELTTAGATFLANSAEDILNIIMN